MVGCMDSIVFQDIGNQMDWSLLDVSVPDTEIPDLDIEMPEMQNPDMPGINLPEVEMPDFNPGDMDISGMIPEICKESFPQVDGFLDQANDFLGNALDQLGMGDDGKDGEGGGDWTEWTDGLGDIFGNLFGENDNNDFNFDKRFGPPGREGQVPPGSPPQPGQGPPGPPHGKPEGGNGNGGPDTRPELLESVNNGQTDFDKPFESVDLDELLAGLDNLDMQGLDLAGLDGLKPNPDASNPSQLIDSLDLALRPGQSIPDWGNLDDMPDICKGIDMGPGPHPGPGMEGPGGHPGRPGPPRESLCNLDDLEISGPLTLDQILDKAGECIDRVLDKFRGLVMDFGSQMGGEMGMSV